MSPQIALNDPNLVAVGLELTFKWLFIIGAILYVFFSLIVLRQISLMKKTLITTVSPLITIFGLIHFGLAVGVLVYYLLFL